MRHCSLLQRAEESLGRVAESIAAGMSEDFFSIDLMDAYEALGEIIGEEIGDDLADEIFRRFCMGK
jgi:tRNA modification GTPase